MYSNAVKRTHWCIIAEIFVIFNCKTYSTFLVKTNAHILAISFTMGNASTIMYFKLSIGIIINAYNIAPFKKSIAICPIHTQLQQIYLQMLVISAKTNPTVPLGLRSDSMERLIAVFVTCVPVGAGC